MAALIPKYRPVLSAEEIVHLSTLCKKDGTKTSLLILSKLAMFEFKIQAQAITPAYKCPPKLTMEEALGFASNHPSPLEGVDINAEACYNVWLTAPETLNVSQLEAVRAWRYQNNKMTLEDEKLFETEILGL